MSDSQESRLTQSFLGLSDDAFHAVPGLEKAIADTISKHIDTHHVSMGTVVTALACVIGEYIVMAGGEAEQSRDWFLKILLMRTSVRERTAQELARIPSGA